MSVVSPPTAFVPRFLSRLRVPGGIEADLRVEKALAYSRLFLALTSFAAWFIRPSGGLAHYQVGLLLLPAYVTASLGLLGWLHRNPRLSHRFAITAQINDLAFPALLCLFADEPTRPFYVLFLFAIIAAAFRWGFVETIATALVSIACLLFQALVLAHGPSVLRAALFSSADTPRLVLRCVFLLMAGVLVGLLAETEKQLRGEIEFSNHVLLVAQIGSRFSTVLQDVLTEIGKVFQGEGVLEIVAQGSSGRIFRWEIPSLANPKIKRSEVAPPDRRYQLMPGYPHTFYMHKNGNGGAAITALNEDGQRVNAHTKHMQMPVADAESVMVVSHELGRDWYGRFIVLNARLGRQREMELRFAQRLMRQVAPALYSVYLVRNFRQRAGATERARVARELHDTTIQSLIGIEMQLDVLRRKPNNAPVAAELDRIQQLLRLEVLNVRELMQSLRPIDIKPHQFLDFLAELVERFCRDTGIAVRFVSDSHEVNLPATTCRELVRVVQEALVNIRKHSSARSAVVRFASENGNCKLVVHDDGAGFPFSGRFTLSEMDTLCRGPAVIRERVRTAGGDMVLESTPGQGSRLEITFPQKGYESYG